MRPKRGVSLLSCKEVEAEDENQYSSRAEVFGQKRDEEVGILERWISDDEVVGAEFVPKNVCQVHGEAMLSSVGREVRVNLDTLNVGMGPSLGDGTEIRSSAATRF